MAEVMRMVNTPGGSAEADALASTLALMAAEAGYQDDELAGAPAFGREAVDEIHAFLRRTNEDAAGGQYTDAGRLARRRLHAEALVVTAATARRKQQALVQELTANVEREMRQHAQPARDVLEFARLRQLQELLEREDPVVREQILLAAARQGDDTGVLRAALTFPGPPMGGIGAWPVLMPADLLAKIREAVAERVSPQGPRAFAADLYGTIATHIERVLATPR
ncbi:MAG: hypothetical protein IT177_18895 [Acidobacteria bacterium]|nr:hypothetical protein [Acidobacteriota bacterium]